MTCSQWRSLYEDDDDDDDNDGEDDDDDGDANDDHNDDGYDNDCEEGNELMNWYLTIIDHEDDIWKFHTCNIWQHSRSSMEQWVLSDVTLCWLLLRGLCIARIIWKLLPSTLQ